MVPKFLFGILDFQGWNELSTSFILKFSFNERDSWGPNTLGILFISLSHRAVLLSLSISEIWGWMKLCLGVGGSVLYRKFSVIPALCPPETGSTFPPVMTFKNFLKLCPMFPGGGVYKTSLQ